MSCLARKLVASAWAQGEAPSTSLPREVFVLQPRTQPYGTGKALQTHFHW